MSQKISHILGWRARNGAEGSLSKKVKLILGWRAVRRGGGLIVPICQVVIRVEGCKEGAEGSLSQKIK